MPRRLRSTDFTCSPCTRGMGLLRGADGGEPLRALDRCRIRWGRLVEIAGDRPPPVRTLPWDGQTLALGPPATETASIARDGYGLAGPLQPGDAVGLHWDGYVTGSRRANLRRCGPSPSRTSIS